MDLIHLNLLVIMLIWRFQIKDIILLESVSKARLIGVRQLSHVELMLWVRGVTIKWYQSLGYDSEEFMKFKL
jgi:hypothetical protein